MNCPVCESPNAPDAAECATCGKAFVVLSVGDAPAATLPELELARIDSASLPAAAEVMPELDLARAAPVNVAADVTPDLDLGRSAAVANVAADPTPDMELTAIAAKEWTPESDGPVVCRACGTPQADLGSKFCGNCGRVLPVRAALQGDIIDAEPVKKKEERIRCFACGAKVFWAPLCTDCGVPMRPLST